MLVDVHQKVQQRPIVPTACVRSVDPMPAWDRNSTASLATTTSPRWTIVGLELFGNSLQRRLQYAPRVRATGRFANVHRTKRCLGGRLNARTKMGGNRYHPPRASKAARQVELLCIEKITQTVEGIGVGSSQRRCVVQNTTPHGTGKLPGQGPRRRTTRCANPSAPHSVAEIDGCRCSSPVPHRRGQGRTRYVSSRCRTGCDKWHPRPGMPVATKGFPPGSRTERSDKLRSSIVISSESGRCWNIAQIPPTLRFGGSCVDGMQPEWRSRSTARCTRCHSCLAVSMGFDSTAAIWYQIL